jgi:transcription elongation factor Spt5
VSEKSPASAQTTIFAVRTTIGRERTVQDLVFSRLRTINPVPDLKAILTADKKFRGYVFIEAYHQRDVILITNGVPHVRGKVVGSIPLEEIGHIIKPERIVKIIEEGDIVEIAEGLFKEKKAQVISMPKEGTKEEVTLRLVGDGEASNITVKIHADYLKLIEKQKKTVTEYVLQDEEAVEGQEDTRTDEERTMEQEEPTRVMIAEEVGKSTDDTFSFSEEGEEEEEEEDVEEDTDEEGEEEDEYADEEEEDDDWAKFMM